MKLLFSRRSHCPKPHIRLLNYDQCPVDFPADPKALFESRQAAAAEAAAGKGDGAAKGVAGNDAGNGNVAIEIGKQSRDIAKDGTRRSSDTSQKTDANDSPPAHSHANDAGVDAPRPDGVVFDAASFGRGAVGGSADDLNAANFFLAGASAFGGAGGVTQRRVIPCGAIMLGDTHIDTQTLFKFAFFAEAVVVSTLICALMRRYVIRNRHIIIKEDVNAWAKIL